MGVNVITDYSTEGKEIKKALEENGEIRNIKSAFTIRWGNWMHSKDTGIIFNTSQAIKNTLDKENVILTLTRNKVRCPRRIKPGRKTDFPIIGRKYEHKNGTDIRIIDSLDEYYTSDCDYFLRYLKIVKEYKVHVMDLEVFYVEEKFHKNSDVLDEPIIRTKAFGWELRATGLSDITKSKKEELYSLATRAIHSLGLDFGVVTIAQAINNKYYVLDVDATCKWNSNGCRKAYIQKFCEIILKYDSLKNTGLDITIGADPECLLKDINSGNIVCASDFFDQNGACGLDDRSIEAGRKYFPIMEIRPSPSTNPIEVFESIEEILTSIYQNVHYKNIGLYAGSMPIFNYWVGGHIHFGIKPNSKLIKALDNYLALPLMMIEKPYTARHRKKKYGMLGNYRLKFHGGFEYCSLSSWLVSPEITLAVLCLSKVIIQEHLNLSEEFLCDYSDIRSFYLVNKNYFKDKIKKILSNIVNTRTYEQYSRILEPFFQRIIQCREWEEDRNIKETWGINSSDEKYVLPSRCYIPKKTRKELNVKLGDLITIEIGSDRYNLKVYPKDDLSSEKMGYVSFSEDICKDIGISTMDNFKLYFDAEEKVYRIGPILGIFSYRTSHYMGPFALQSYYFRKLIKLSKNKGMLTYVFTIWDIDWEDERIKGYIYDFQKDDWITGYFPLPDVIYDRGDVVTEDNYGQYAVDYLENIKKYNIRLINSIEFINTTNNKWSTYLLINSSESTKEHQPDTSEYDNTKTLIKFIEKYNEVFLKMKDGTRSKGIFYIKRIDDKSLSVQYKNIYGYNVTLLCHKTKLVELIDEKIKEMKCLKADYVIQQAIPLAKYKGHKFEIRVVMQKNSKGIWLRTCMVARIISNQEGFIDVWNEKNEKYFEVLNGCFGDEANQVAEAIREIAHNIVSIIDEKGIQAGELAIDFGIDSQKNIYIIELNSKPDNLLTRIGAFRMRNLACNRILEYARFLVFSEQKISSEGPL